MYHSIIWWFGYDSSSWRDFSSALYELLHIESLNLVKVLNWVVCTVYIPYFNLKRSCNYRYLLLGFPTIIVRIMARKHLGWRQCSAKRARGSASKMIFSLNTILACKRKFWREIWILNIHGNDNKYYAFRTILIN